MDGLAISARHGAVGHPIPCVRCQCSLPPIDLTTVFGHQSNSCWWVSLISVLGGNNVVLFIDVHANVGSEVSPHGGGGFSAQQSTSCCPPRLAHWMTCNTHTRTHFALTWFWHLSSLQWHCRSDGWPKTLLLFPIFCRVR